MISAGIGLGIGIAIHVPSTLPNQTIPTEDVLQPITDFGIARNDIRKLEPTCRELSAMHSIIKAYMENLRCLIELKAKLG